MIGSTTLAGLLIVVLTGVWFRYSNSFIRSANLRRNRNGFRSRKPANSSFRHSLVMRCSRLPIVANEIAQRRDRAIEEDLSRWIDAVAFRLSAGMSLPTAVAEGSSVAAGPMKGPLATFAAGINDGLSLLEATAELKASVAHPLVVAAASVLEVANRTGGRSFQQLREFSSVIYERSHLRKEGRALAGQARSSAAVLMIMPFLFMFGTSIFDARTRHWIFLTPAGLVVLALGLSLEMFGAYWMSRIVGRF